MANKLVDSACIGQQLSGPANLTTSQSLATDVDVSTCGVKLNTLVVSKSVSIPGPWVAVIGSNSETRLSLSDIVLTLVKQEINFYPYVETYAILRANWHPANWRTVTRLIGNSYVDVVLNFSVDIRNSAGGTLYTVNCREFVSCPANQAYQVTRRYESVGDIYDEFFTFYIAAQLHSVWMQC